MSAEPTLREQLIERLLEGRRRLPTSAAGRLGRTAVTMLRSGRLAWRGNGEVDVEALAKIVTSIGQLKGVTMKVGQIMSYIDVAVPEELREALSALQTHAQPMPFEQVGDILAAELGDRGRELCARLEPEPVAAASIGQVHCGTLPDQSKVAVKVQYPEVEQAIRADFKPTAIGTTISSIVYPGARIDQFIAEARERFLEECDYEHEARSQQRFAELYRGHPLLLVPDVHHDLSSRRVLTSTWVEGVGFDDFLGEDPDAPTRDRIGAALFEIYVGSLFRHRLYNCDPHPGNYLFLAGGRVAMLDYGCTREFPASFVDALRRLTLAVHRDDRDDLHRAFLGLGMVSEGKRYSFEVARDLVRSFYGPMLEDRMQAIELGAAKSMGEIFTAKRELMKLSLPGEFLFLFRIRFGLMSVLARLGARANWYRLERDMVGVPPA
jgi:predicted unusual protein kinase regulating ubiquinone biosynthesis (AarF/ABC1/UbiB family)